MKDNTTMNIMNRFRTFALGILLVLVAMPLSAQTIMKNTTLAAAITSTTQTTIQLTTITFTPAIATGDGIFVGTEYMRVTVAPTTVFVSVQRGMGGTRATIHANATRVYTGTPNQFYDVDPPWDMTCIRGQQTVLPWINKGPNSVGGGVGKGIVWTCGFLGNSATASLAWRAYSPIVLTYNSLPVGRFDAPDAPWFTVPKALRGWVTH